MSRGAFRGPTAGGDREASGRTWSWGSTPTTAPCLRSSAPRIPRGALRRRDRDEGRVLPGVPDGAAAGSGGRCGGGEDPDRLLRGSRARGYALYEEMVALAKDLGYLVIADVKRGDIGSTAEAYARAHLDVAGADAVTVNPYFGTDGLEPFFRQGRERGQGRVRACQDVEPQFGRDTGSAARVRGARLRAGRGAGERVGPGHGRGPWIPGDRRGGRGDSSRAGREPATADDRSAPPHPGLRGAGRHRPPTWPPFSMLKAQERWSIRLGPSCTLTGRHPERHWLDAARDEAAEMRAALWAAAGRG